MAEAESSTDQRMFKGAEGGDVWGGYLGCSAMDDKPLASAAFDEQIILCAY